jgi:hypothetical protein
MTENGYLEQQVVQKCELFVQFLSARTILNNSKQSLFSSC